MVTTRAANLRTWVDGRTVRAVRSWLSRAALCLFYFLFAYAHLVALVEGGFRLSLALLVVFETIMIVLVFVRRDHSAVDLRPVVVAAGMIGTFAPLLFRPGAAEGELVVGQAIQLVGIMLQFGAAYSLGRSFGIVPANRGIQTGGMFQIVRHPFYLAYLVGQIGYLLSNLTTRNIGILVVTVGFQVIRIRYEERLLSKDPDYRAYAAGVRWHLMPGIW